MLTVQTWDGFVLSSSLPEKLRGIGFLFPFLSRFMTIGHSTPAGDGFTISSESHLTDRPFLACPRSSYEVCCQIGLLHCLRFPMTSVHPQSAVTTEPFVSRPIFPALIGTHSIGPVEKEEGKPSQAHKNIVSKRLFKG